MNGCIRRSTVRHLLSQNPAQWRRGGLGSVGANNLVEFVALRYVINMAVDQFVAVDDLVPIGEEGIGKMAAEVPRDSGYEIAPPFHQVLPPSPAISNRARWTAMPMNNAKTERAAPFPRADASGCRTQA